MAKMKITHEERFSDVELARMFNVECDPNGEDRNAKARYIDAPYAFNDINCPLWTIRKRTLKRGEKKARQTEDFVRPGITTAKPGSDRVADLAKFYAENAEEEKSAFLI
jgi:hypothetical protein